MGNDTGAEPRGGFKVVGAGETPEDAGNPQTAGEASEPGKQPRALRPRIIVLGLGGAGGNAVHNMIEGQLEGVELFVANTDSQALETSICEHRLQLGRELTGGLGAGGRPEVGRAAAEESLDEVLSAVSGASLVFIAAGMGGGTGTGSAPVVAEAIRKKGVLTVAVVTKPFRFEGEVRMEVAEQGISALEKHVDTLIVIPNQNLFKIATEKTSVSDAFHRADNVLFAGVRGVTDLMVKPGLINLDFADFRSVMTQTGKAIMGAGEADGPQRAVNAAEAAMANPLLEDSSVDGARGVLINVTGGRDLTLFELDEAVESVRTAAHPKANIIVGSAFDEGLEGKIRVSVLATGILPKQAKAPAAKAEGGDTATATTTKSAEPTVKADEPGSQAAAPKAGAGAAAAPAKASAHAAEAAQVAERPAESAASAQAGPPTQPEASAPTTAKAEDSAKAATPGAAPPAADEQAQAEAKKPDQPAGASPQAPVSEATPAKTATAKAETPPPPEPAEAQAMPTPATAEPEASTPAEPTIAGPEAKHADAETKVPSAEAPKVEAAPAKAPPAETPAKAEAEAPAKVPAGDRRLTLEDILRRAEQAMETQKAAEAAAAEKTAEAPTPPAPEPAAETSPPPAPEPVAKAEAQPAAPTPESAADIEAQPTASEPQPAPAEAAPDDDANLDALIDEVLIRNRKAADFEPKEPSLQVPPASAPEGPEAGGTSTDALLEDLAFSLASDDPFVLDESAAVRGTDDKDLEALFGAAAAETAVPAGEAAESAPMPPPDPAPSLEEDSDDAFQAELDRRARERARAALEALSEPSGESKAKPKPEEEDSDEALREIMNIPSFLRRTDD